jgi:hypothetical protein
MSNYIISLIRTYVPVGVGAVASWLLLHYAFHVSPAITSGITALLTTGITYGYYALVRALELKFPWIGGFLGHTAKPVYVPSGVKTK